MRTVTFKSVIEGTAMLGGVSPSDPVYTQIAPELAHHITTAYRLAWDLYDWPETLCYIADTIESHPTATSAKYLPWTNGDRDIKTLFGVSKYDPRVKEHPEPITGYRLGPDGFYFPETTETAVWLEYREPAPRFTSTAYAAGTAYVTGDLVYYSTTGECYRAKQSTTGNAPTNTTYWLKLDFMALLDEAVKAAAHAARTRAEGREQTAAFIQSVVEDHLENEIDLLDQQSQRFKRTTRR